MVDQLPIGKQGEDYRPVDLNIHGVDIVVPAGLNLPSEYALAFGDLPTGMNIVGAELRGKPEVPGAFSFVLCNKSGCRQYFLTIEPYGERHFTFGGVLSAMRALNSGKVTARRKAWVRFRDVSLAVQASDLFGYMGADGQTSPANTSQAILSVPAIFDIAKGNTYTISIEPLDRRITIAYPASLGEIAGIRYAELSNADVTDTFTKTTVQVSASGSDLQPYFVYTYIAAIPFGDYVTYTATL